MWLKLHFCFFKELDNLVITGPTGTNVNDLIFLFAFFVMVVGGMILMYTRFILEVKSAALQLPLGFVYIILPISGLIIMFYEVLHILELKQSN